MSFATNALEVVLADGRIEGRAIIERLRDRPAGPDDDELLEQAPALREWPDRDVGAVDPQEVEHHESHWDGEVEVQDATTDVREPRHAVFPRHELPVEQPLFQSRIRMSRARADDGTRTHDTWLGKPVLYQLSYVRARVDSSPALTVP